MRVGEGSLSVRAHVQRSFLRITAGQAFRRFLAKLLVNFINVCYERPMPQTSCCMESTIERESGNELSIAIAFRKIIEQAGEAGASNGRASPAHGIPGTVQPWHRGKND